MSVCSAVASPLPGVKGTFTFDFPFLIASSNATLPPSTIISATLALTFAAIPSKT